MFRSFEVPLVPMHNGPVRRQKLRKATSIDSRDRTRCYTRIQEVIFAVVQAVIKKQKQSIYLIARMFYIY